MPVAEVVPDKVDLATAKYYKDYIYVYGGYGVGLYGLFYRYSLQDLKWENITNESYIGVAVEAPGIVHNGSLYALFGDDENDYTGIISRVSLDNEEWVWEKIDMSFGYLRDGFTCNQVGDFFYLFGGYYNNRFNDLLMLTITDLNISLQTIIPTYIYPEARSNHALIQVNKYLYLYGGLGNTGYFSDMWTFDIDQETWSLLSPFGSLPTARHLFAYGSFGDALVIWGGEDSTGLLNDIHIYNSITNKWTTITSLSYILPTSRKGACAVFQMPDIFIYGGETQNGFSSELWVFNLGTFQYSLVSNSKIAIAYSSCQVVDNEFFVLFGLDETRNNVYAENVYNFDTGVWSVKNSLSSSAGGTQGAAFKAKEKLVYYGGRDDYNKGFKYLNVDYNGKNYYISTDMNPYNMAFASYKTRLYFSGGGSISIYRVLTPMIFDKALSYIELNNTFDGVYFDCSPGTYFDGHRCMDCLPGTYSENYGNSECIPCQPGRFSTTEGATSNRQCLPCPEGSFNEQYGQTYCINCPSFSYCPSGCTTPVDQSLNISTSSVQPAIFPNSQNTEFINTIILSASISLYSLLVLILIPKCRKNVANFDIYISSHNYEKNVPIVKQKTCFGGFFSIVFLISSIILILSILLQFLLNNQTEIKILEPLIVLENEVDMFYTDLTIVVTIMEYSEACVVNSTCSEKIKISYDHIVTTKEPTISCQKSSINSCIIVYTCQYCSVDSLAYLSFGFYEDNSFSGGIAVQVLSNSSIPDSISSISTGFYATAGTVLVGSIESSFYFVLTPSLFRSGLSKYPSELTGYHVSLEKPPQHGSENFIEDLCFLNHFEVSVYLSISLSGLYTYRFQTQGVVLVISGLLGSIVGIMGAVGFLLKMVEGKYLVVKNILKKKLSVKALAENNFLLKRTLPDLVWCRRRGVFNSIHDKRSSARAFNMALKL